MSKYSIRKLTSSDTDGLLTFYRTLSENIVRFFEPFGRGNDDAVRNHLAETDAGKHISIGLVGSDGAIEGHVFILSVADERPVFGIGLQEHLHGMGWGRKLATAVLEEADDWGLPLITLTVLKTNHRAQNLYASLGFETKGEHSFRQENDSWYMERLRQRDYS